MTIACSASHPSDSARTCRIGQRRIEGNIGYNDEPQGANKSNTMQGEYIAKGRLSVSNLMHIVLCGIKNAVIW